MQRFLLLVLLAASAVAQEIPVSDPTFEPANVPAAVAVAASGDRFITAWGYGAICCDLPVNGGVFASVTDLSGNRIRGPVTISLTGGSPAIAGGANRSLIAWLDGNTGYTATIDNDGNVSSSALLLSGPLIGDPQSVTWDGSRFLVLWRARPAGVIGFLFDQNGAKLSGPFPVSDWTATATTDAGGFLIFATVAAQNGFTIQSRRIDSSTATPVTTAPTSLPNIAAAGRALFWEVGGVLHRVMTDSNSDSIIATGTLSLQKASGSLLQFFSFAGQRSLMLIDAQGAVVATQPVPFAFDFASIGSTALLATSTPLRAYPTNVNGTIQIGQPEDLGRMATAQLFPQVASNGSLLLATWYEPTTSQIFAARVDPIARKHLDGRGIPIDSQAHGKAAAVAALGDGWLIAYLEVSSGVAHLWTRRVFPEGTLDSARTLVSTTVQPQPPRIVSDGNQALLVWTDTSYKVRGTRISREGNILDPAFLQISDADTLPLQFAPDVTIDGDNYSVIWQGQRTAPIQVHLSSIQVTKSGVVLDPPAATNMIFAYRAAGNAIAGALTDVLVYLPGRSPIDLGQHSFGDIEKFRGGFLVAGSDPRGLWASEIAGDAATSPFTIALPAAASQVSLGDAIVYIRATGDEGYGGSMRAYVLPISEQRRRPMSPGR